MKDNGYIEFGKTKMVSIQYNVSFPHLTYFIAVNMMVEFTSMGQVIPTRIDVLPYKFSPFATYKEDATSTIDILKFMLVLYTFWAVYKNFVQYYKSGQLLNISNIADNFTDMIIVIMQTVCFAIKV